MSINKQKTPKKNLISDHASLIQNREQKAIDTLQNFSEIMDTKDLEKELWDQLIYTMYAAEFMDGNERVNHLTIYKMLVKTSKAIHVLFPFNKKPRVVING